MNLDKQTADLIELHNFFAQTKYGQSLVKNIRYGRYKPEHWSNEKWEEVLGIDVNNLRHLLNILMFTKEFVETAEGMFSEKTKSILLLSAVTHDWGEAVVGDIITDLKTGEQEKKELIAFREVASETLSLYKEKEYYATMNSVEDVIFSDSFLHSVFKNVVEELAALTTAIRAWQEAKNYPAEASYLQWISVNVFVYIHKPLKWAGYFELVPKFFAANRDVITEIFTAMPTPVFEHYNYDLKEKAQKIEMFEKAKTLWFQAQYAN
ncbi:MAG: hypothetical protein V1867_03235 [Candidatus Falkowbacteria bacterium]